MKTIACLTTMDDSWELANEEITLTVDTLVRDVKKEAGKEEKKDEEQ